METLGYKVMSTEPNCLHFLCIPFIKRNPPPQELVPCGTNSRVAVPLNRSSLTFSIQGSISPYLQSSLHSTCSSVRITHLIQRFLSLELSELQYKINLSNCRYLRFVYMCRHSFKGDHIKHSSTRLFHSYKNFTMFFFSSIKSRRHFIQISFRRLLPLDFFFCSSGIKKRER